MALGVGIPTPGVQEGTEKLLSAQLELSMGNEVTHEPLSTKFLIQ